MEAECLLFYKCLRLKRKMQTVHKKVEANEYVAAGGSGMVGALSGGKGNVSEHKDNPDDSEKAEAGLVLLRACMAEDDQLTGVARFLWLIMLRVRAAFFFGRLSVCAGSCWPTGKSAEPTQTGREIAAGPPAVHLW